MRDGDVVDLGRVDRNLWATKQQTLAGGSGCADSTTMKLKGEKPQPRTRETKKKCGNSWFDMNKSQQYRARGCAGYLWRGAEGNSMSFLELLLCLCCRCEVNEKWSLC
jgi:hypothetical protein